jgi:circadian clock protein KaiB
LASITKRCDDSAISIKQYYDASRSSSSLSRVSRAESMSPLKKTYILKLYVAGNTPNSVRALKTLNNILEKEFQGVYALKVIDVLKNPQLAEEDKILATPTLAKILPPPVRKIIGDLSDRERVLIGLDLLYDELQEDKLEDFPEQ